MSSGHFVTTGVLLGGTFVVTLAVPNPKKTPPGRPDGGGFCVLTRRSELRCHVVLDPVTLVNMDEHVVQEVDG